MGDFVDPNTLERILIQDTEVGKRSTQHKVVTKLFPILGAVRQLFAEQVYLHGINENLYSDGEAIKGPFLWLMKHESWYDIINYPPAFLKVPNHPKYMVLGRRGYTHVPPLDYLIGKVFNIRYITRNWMEQDMEEEKKKKAEIENRKSIKEVLDGFQEGIHTFILPEGTTKNNGAIAKIRSGAYNASHLVYDGKLYVVNCMPVGNTYDLMSGKDGKHLMFIEAGKLFQYHPVDYEGESEADYIKKDIGEFAKVIRMNLAQLHTVTLSQIVGSKMRMAAERGEPFIFASELNECVASVLGEIDCLGEEVFIDPMLKEDPKSRFKNFYSSLPQHGYGRKMGDKVWIDGERILCVPSDAHYKRDNPLGYMTNRIESVLEERPMLKEAFEKGLR